MSTPTDRARGALYGLAIGDASDATQLMSHEEVAACFVSSTGSGKHRRTIRSQPLPAGSITDDTEQALLLADALLVGGGQPGTEDLARRLRSGPSARANGDR